MAHGAPKSFRLEALRAARTEVLSEDLGRFGGEDTSAYLSALLVLSLSAWQFLHSFIHSYNYLFIIHSFILSINQIFGRLADHMGIGNSKYIPDKPLPFALWISLPLSRRFKNDKPQCKKHAFTVRVRG
ncbi:hypothetical protein AAMO2058_001574800 [Amorphochlora amoebiformis]